MHDPERNRDRLARLLAAKAAGQLDYPLSWAQQRMWFLAQLEPDSGAYTIVSSNPLRTVLDADTLEASFGTIVGRHQALRTVFPVVDSRPVQRVLADQPVNVRRLDLTTDDDLDAAITRLVAAETEEPFDLATGPLIRVTLARTGARESLLIIAVHHIVIDGWSFDLLLAELNRCYAAHRLGASPQLPVLGIQYPDWSRWQRRWLTEERMAGQLDYFRRELAGAPPLLRWPSDHPRPARRTGAGSALRTRLDPEIGAALFGLGRQEQATTFVSMLAAYVLLLGRWTGEPDLLIGTPVANRPRAELQDLIGLFLNTLALRIRCPAEITFRELLRRTRDVMLGALSHQDLPFERLVSELRPTRDLSYTPIFQTMFVLRSAEAGEPPAPSPAAEPGPMAAPPLTTSKFDLAVNAYQVGDTVDLLWEYSTDLFEADTVAELAAVFPALVRAVCAEPDRAVDSLFADQPLLGPRARPEPEKVRVATAEAGARRRIDPGPDAATEEVELRLADIWSETLGVPVGRHDNFFELGGHSLSAAQVVARIRDAFRLELALRAIFELPTVAELATELARTAAVSGPQLVAMPRDRELPLSFAQERLWFLHQLDSDSAAYNVPAVRWIHGPLDPGLMQRALTQVIERHEVLRTTYPSVHGRPTLRVNQASVQLGVVDLSDRAIPEAIEQARRIADEEADRPFDLAEGPVLRARLVRLSRETHLLLLTVHHIAIDGWSLEVLFGDLDTFRHALEQHRAPDLAPLEVHYADWAHWQRATLAGVRLESLLHYWREALAGAPEMLDLPTDRPRLESQPRGRSYAFWLDAELRQRIEQVGRRYETTPFVVILAALGLVLARWSGQRDLVIGSPVASRSTAAVERLVGLFVNTAPLRVRLEPGDTFASLLDRARETTLGALAHAELPFERLVMDLRPERSMTRNPLFQVMLVLQNHPVPGLDEIKVGGDAQPAPPPGGSAKFDLSVFVTPSRDRYQVGVEYAGELLDLETIERFGQRLGQVLVAALRDLDAPLASLPGLTEAEAAPVLEWSRAAQPDRPAAGDVVDRVLAQAAARPDAIALTAAGRSISYAQLVAQARGLAGRLAPLVEPDEPVGLCVRRGPDGIAAMLGILLTGAAYLPLDPGYPTARLRLMIDHARPRVVVVDEATRSLLPAGTIGLELELESWSVSGPSPRRPDRDADRHPDRLAYVIHTSGSQGTPKAVAVPHRVLGDLVDWQVRRSDLPPGAVTAQFAPWSFDVSAQEIFATLTAGGRLVLLDEDERRDPQLTWSRVLAEGVNRLFLPPAALPGLVAAAPADVGGDLREVVVAGEPLVLDPAITSLLARHPALRLYNQYGPAETHVVSEHRVADPVDARPPVGKPLPGAQLYVLDAWLGLAPVGAIGELYIGGAPVSRGYLHRPDLTAERFVPDPFTEPGSPGERLYRTGDRARWRPDGTLDLLGRLDEQVKIRGFRVEPGEVEAAIARTPGVRTVAVTAAGTGAQRRLSATVVTTDGRPLDVTTLRARLRATLPDFLVPTLFRQADRLRLTPSGKVDRRALAAHGVAVDPASSAGRRPPETPEQKALAEIWGEVLERPDVGPDDDFFELGGHSLLATQVVARIADRLGVRIELRTLFDRPTLAGLAEAVADALAGAGDLRPGSHQPAAVS